MLSLLETLGVDLPGAGAAMLRSLGFAALVPTLGSGGFKPRLLLAALLWLILLPTCEPTRADSNLVAESVVQLATGLLIGLALRVTVTAVAAAAQFVEQQMGLPYWGDGDELEAATPLAGLYQLSAITMFLCAGGHRLVVQALLEQPSVSAARDVTFFLPVHAAVQLVTGACWLTLRLAAPVTMALLSGNLVAGMMARVSPQFAYAGCAAPLQIAGGLLLVLALLAGVAGEAPEALALSLRDLGSW